jgi:seryl-tRNA(Sec) selenium transferase
VEAIKEQMLDVVSTEGVDPETVARLVRSFDQWEQAKEYGKKERKRVNDQLAGRIAQFAEAMNVGHSTTNDQVLKLSVVESRWQDLEDAREERKQIIAACRDAVKAAEQKIRDMLASIKSTQLDLFNSAAGSAAEVGVDDDADDNQTS